VLEPLELKPPLEDMLKPRELLPDNKEFEPLESPLDDKTPEPLDPVGAGPPPSSATPESPVGSLIVFAPHAKAAVTARTLAESCPTTSQTCLPCLFNM
jgi:hypothetical protein